MGEQSEQPQKNIFREALTELEKRGRITQLGHQRLVKEYGHEVANDTLESPKPLPTAEALTQLIESIPGAKVTPEMKLSLLKPINVSASHAAISATLLGKQSGPNEIGISVGFPEHPQDNYVWIRFNRTTNSDRLEIKLRMTREGEVTRGWVSLGEVDKQYRYFSIHRGEIMVDADGNIERADGDLTATSQGISKIDIQKAVSFIENPENFGKPIDLTGFFEEVKTI